MSKTSLHRLSRRNFLTTDAVSAMLQSNSTADEIADVGGGNNRRLFGKATTV
jgi:hypothetical protein